MTIDIERPLSFAQEREAIRLRRAAGEGAPWTRDPIMADWSFCNVRREDDRVTQMDRSELAGTLL